MFTFMSGVPLFWLFIVIGALAAVFGLRSWLGSRNLERDAIADWRYQVKENMHDMRLTEGAFVRAYKKVNAPRAAQYVAGALLAILVITPIALAAITGALHALWMATGQSRVYEPGYLVWMFMIFFMLIAIWVTIMTIASRRYHKYAPGLMRDELIAERSGFMPSEPAAFGPNPVHIKAGDNAKQYQSVFEDILGLQKTHDADWNGSGIACDIYTAQGGMSVCVHQPEPSQDYKRETHPFFFPKNYARDDDKEIRYTLIFLKENAYGLLQDIEASGLDIQKSTGREGGRMCSLTCANLDIFLYEKQG